jgi:hypothetical protein
MNNQPLLLRALWSALGVTAYIVLVATIMFNAEHIFAPMQRTIIGPLAFLMLFVFSALVTGTMVLLPPLRLYLDGQKTDGVRLLVFTAFWLGLITVATMLVLALMS